MGGPMDGGSGAGRYDSLEESMHGGDGGDGEEGDLHIEEDGNYKDYNNEEEERSPNNA